jgi:molybdopterin-guanine dinucleotide biosynthesis protein A
MTAAAHGHPSAALDHTVAIILAGGAGSRLGGVAKALVRLDGETFLERVIRAVAPAVQEIVVVAAAGQDLGLPAVMAPPLEPAVPVRVIPDSVAAAGPLSALADGLRAMDESNPARVFVVSCDVPRLSTAVVRLVLDSLADSPDADWAVPEVGGHPQVLVSALRPRMLGGIDTHFAAGRRDLRGLFSRVAVRTIAEAALRRVDPGLESFRDVDTPDDLAGMALRSNAWALGDAERR